MVCPGDALHPPTFVRPFTATFETRAEPWPARGRPRPAEWPLALETAH